MLQRIQSIFLALTAVVMIVVIFLPLWEKNDMEKSEVVTITALEITHIRYADGATAVDEVITEKNIMYVAALCLIAAGVAMFSIFQYTNRLRQIQFGALNSLIIAGAMFLTLYFIWNAEKMVLPSEKGVYNNAFYLFPVALILNSLANRFIRRDEKLVRDSDRLR
jgi:ABC-type iron transport system FetAB permease component